MSAIVTAPNPVLRQTAKPVTLVDKRLLRLISDMRQTLISARDPVGVGLAAPQVGVALRLFLIRPKTNQEPQVFINPEIIKYSQRQQSETKKDGVYEGCLSIPHHYAPIKRSMSVTVKYQSLNQPIPNTTNKADLALDIDRFLIEKTEVFSGFPAHIIQHEMDHLNGILFIDHALSQNTKLFKIQGKNWEEISL
jgi:peptide deformylase